MSYGQQSPCRVYDFTVPSGLTSTDNLTIGDVQLIAEDLADGLSDICKSWTFQLEKGTVTGYIHWQGRCNLLEKARLPTVQKLFREHVASDAHVSLTSTSNMNNVTYVTKDNTKLFGPWTDVIRDLVKHHVDKIMVFDHIVETWKPFQETIIKMIKDHSKAVRAFQKCPSPSAFKMSGIDTRHVDCVIQFRGNVGKTLLSHHLRTREMAHVIPQFGNYQDIMACILAKPPSLAYILDMPKSIADDKFRTKTVETYSAIESIKDGLCFDKRHSYRERWQNPPLVFIFTNKVPDIKYLSRDRWRFWTIKDDELISVNHILNNQFVKELSDDGFSDEEKESMLFSQL